METADRYENQKIFLNGNGRRSASTIAKLSHDEYVSLEILERICRALHCEIGDVAELRREAEES